MKRSTPARCFHVLSPLVAALMAVAGSSAWAQAQDQASPASAAQRGATPASTATGASSLSRADHDFVLKASMGGQMEVELGRLAQDRAQNDEVKRFAARMVTDHGRVNDELRTLAATKGLALPASGDGDAAPGTGKRDAAARNDAGSPQRELQRLQAVSSANFDREYMKAMVSQHKTDVALFQKAGASAQDAELKAFAQRTLPALQEHLQMARSLNDRIATNPRSGSGHGGASAASQPSR